MAVEQSELRALILDNANNPHLDISSYFLVGNRGIILITIRNLECKVYVIHELGVRVNGEVAMLLLRMVIRMLGCFGTRGDATGLLYNRSKALVDNLLIFHAVPTACHYRTRTASTGQSDSHFLGH
jgi:hypothetical protein